MKIYQVVPSHSLIFPFQQLNTGVKYAFLEASFFFQEKMTILVFFKVFSSSNIMLVYFIYLFTCLFFFLFHSMKWSYFV